MTTFKVFVSGQSNSIGRGLGGSAWNPPSTFKVWNNSNDKDECPNWSKGGKWISPKQEKHPFNTFGIFQNIGYTFCQEYLEENPNDNVRMLMVSKGGTSIDEWVSDTTPMMTRIIDVAKKCAFVKANVFIWHQGEADYALKGATTMFSFQSQIRDELVSAGIIKSNAIMLIGGLGESGSGRIEYNNELKLLIEGQRYFNFVNSSNLDLQDTSHFDGPSLIKLGKRYYNSWKEKIT